MDTYSPEDAAGDLQLEIGDPRPIHELRTPGAWRWLAPLGLCASFAGVIGISIFARPEAASIELSDPVPALSTTGHYEPWVEQVRSVAPVPIVSAPADATAPVPELAAVDEPAPKATVATPARQPVTLAAVAPVNPPHAAAEPAPTRPPTQDADADGDLPSVERDEGDGNDADDADDDTDAATEPAANDETEADAAAPDEPSPSMDDADLEPALPGSGD